MGNVYYSCLATGYPTPSYEWFKEDYENDILRESLIDPLQDNRYTISGGSLIIYNPNQVRLYPLFSTIGNYIVNKCLVSIIYY